MVHAGPVQGSEARMRSRRACSGGVANADHGELRASPPVRSPQVRLCLKSGSTGSALDESGSAALVASSLEIPTSGVGDLPNPPMGCVAQEPSFGHAESREPRAITPPDLADCELLVVARLQHAPHAFPHSLDHIASSRRAPGLLDDSQDRQPIFALREDRAWYRPWRGWLVIGRHILLHSVQSCAVHMIRFVEQAEKHLLSCVGERSRSA
jgi:hypothetical protein